MCRHTGKLFPVGTGRSIFPPFNGIGIFWGKPVPLSPCQRGDHTVTNGNRFGFPGAYARTAASFFLAFLVGILFLGLMFGLPNATAGAESNPKQTTVYEKAGDWSFKTMDGKTTAFSDFRGKVVFLNFWATWCVPCVEEMPGIQRLIGTMKDHDVAFLLITDEKEEKVRGFLEKHRMDLPVYIRDRNTPDAFKTKRLPITYILDRGGNIAMRRTGSTEWDDPVCQDFIRGLTKACTK